MATITRKRMIDPSIWDDRDFIKLSYPARLLWIGLLSNADDLGRGFGDFQSIKNKIFGFDKISLKKIAKLCSELRKNMKNIQFYSQNDQIYYQLSRWEEYQYIKKDRIRESKIPSSDGQVSDKCRTSVAVDKNRIDKNRIEESQTYPSDLKLSQLLYNLIKKRTPEWYHTPNLNEWADEIRKLREIDTQPLEVIEKVINWCQVDDFWAKNILSTTKLRKQFPTLLVQMNSKPKKAFYKGDPMRKHFGAWEVSVGGEWKQFSGSEKDITYK